MLSGTTTTAVGGGWTYPLGLLSDGAHTIFATVTSGGATSAPSSNFIFTINAGVTNLPSGAVVGGNMPMRSPASSGIFKWGGYQFYPENDTTNPAACVIVSLHELDFTVRPQDATSYDGTSRTEINAQFNTSIVDGGTLQITYEVMLSASNPVNDSYSGGPFGGNSWFIIGQLQADNPGTFGSSNPPYEQLLGNVAHGGDAPNVWLNNYNEVNNHVAYAGTVALTRGVWHTYDLILRPGAAGTAQTWIDGVLVNNTSGGFGGPGRQPYFWKMGIYRGPDQPTQNQTQTVRYRNFLINYA